MFDELERITYQSGDQIFEEGDIGDCAYLIENGRIDISTRKGKKFFRIATLQEGELFGEMALIDNAPRNATVVALEKTCLVRIPRAFIEAEFAKGNAILEHVLRLILKRFRQTQDRLIGKDKITSEVKDQEPDEAFSQTQEHLIEHIRIASDIGEALKRNEFRLYYQPIILIKDERLAGFEALIRWMHPEKGMIPPMQFLNVAEETDQILPIGIWTLEQACRDFKELCKDSHDTSRQLPLFISVNVSARQLIKEGDTAQFANILQSAGVDPACIKLEVTETIMIEDPKNAVQILITLRDLGFPMSLDDFGTGYSSLSHLQAFPVDTIKIDRSFISRMLSDKGSMQIVKGSIDLARSMGLEVVAEGVEDKEEVEQLKNLNCSYAQGYYYAKPLPLAEAIEYMKKDP